MKPDIQFSVLCEDVRQERSGSFIFVGVTSVLQSLKFPQRYPRLFIVNGWCKGVGKHSQSIKVISRQDDQVLFGNNEVHFSLKDLTDKKIIVAQFQNVVIPVAGEYSVEIHLNGHLKLAYPVLAQRVRARTSS